MRLVFCLHNHQPEGVPPESLQEAYEKAYLPTLQTIAEHPSIRVVLHSSGCLLENLLLERPEYLELLRRLVERGQVELLTSGIYEPILSAVSERDRVAQIRAYNDLIERHLGVRPRGIWLPEGVWEPSLPKALVQAGVEYLPIDDAHFFRLGFSEKRLLDTYLTDEEGMPVRIFPAAMSLRNLIPFGKPEEVVAHLLKRRSSGAKLSVFADVGEKFGLWPGTYETVRKGRWLSRFFGLLEQEQQRIRTCTFAEYADRIPAGGQIYLPATAHQELLEWSLPPGSQRKLHELKVRLEQEGEGGERMLGAGFWRNFLVRYPEANWMHKRGLDLDKRLRRIEETGGDPEQVTTARRHLWKSQCHSAYWHGVFGGIYLPHLREAVYAHQLAAWRVMDSLEHGEGPFVRLSHRDIDMDGEEEVCLENRELALIFAPRDGGTLVSFDSKVAWVNLLDTLARREEAYHRSFRDRKGERGTPRGGEAPGGIRIKNRNITSYLRYDPYPLHSLRDHLLPGDAGVRSLQEMRTLTEPPARLPMSWERDGDGRVVFRGTFHRDGRPTEVERVVTLAGDAGRVEVRWHVRFPEGLPEGEYSYATEWALGLQASDPSDRTIELNGAGRESLDEEAESDGVTRFGLAHRRSGLRVRFLTAESCRLVRFPVETISLSESSVERVFQGSRLFLLWPLRPGSREFGTTLEVVLEA